MILAKNGKCLCNVSDSAADDHDHDKGKSTIAFLALFTRYIPKLSVVSHIHVQHWRHRRSLANLYKGCLSHTWFNSHSVKWWLISVCFLVIYSHLFNVSSPGCLLFLSPTLWYGTVSLVKCLWYGGDQINVFLLEMQWTLCGIIFIWVFIHPVLIHVTKTTLLVQHIIQHSLFSRMGLRSQFT